MLPVTSLVKRILPSKIIQIVKETSSCSPLYHLLEDEFNVLGLFPLNIETSLKNLLTILSL